MLWCRLCHELTDAQDSRGRFAITAFGMKMTCVPHRSCARAGFDQQGHAARHEQASSSSPYFPGALAWTLCFCRAAKGPGWQPITTRVRADGCNFFIIFVPLLIVWVCPVITETLIHDPPVRQARKPLNTLPYFISHRLPVMRFGINTFFSPRPLRNESTKPVPRFKKWGFIP